MLNNNSYMTVFDEVEIGHDSDCGGSIKIYIQVPWSQKDYKSIKSELLETIDTLDHSMITVNKQAKDFYKRYFIVRDYKNRNIFKDIFDIIFCDIEPLIKNNEWNEVKITIEYDKIKVTESYNDFSSNKSNITERWYE